MSQNRAPAGLSDFSDYYMVLDLRPDATANEIREAYFRAKATYQKDNIALYSIIEGDEREEMLRSIEEAYQVLSSPEKRRDYDRFFGQIMADPMAAAEEAERKKSEQREPAKVISIGRAASVEFPSDERSQNAQSTPFETTSTQRYLGATPQGRHSPSAFQKPETSSSFVPSAMAQVPAPQAQVKTVSKASLEIENEILQQTDWSGAFLRKVREARGVSIEEVTQATKITKAYIMAIEEEAYAKLPAAVFIRGFVGQLARLLRLPHQQVAASYMSRVQKTNPEKFR